MFKHKLDESSFLLVKLPIPYYLWQAFWNHVN